MQRDGAKPPEGLAAGKALRKYLAQHAEPESAWVRECLTATPRYGHVLCIPAYGEGESLDRAIASIPTDGGPRLVIVVLNDRADSPRDKIEAATTSADEGRSNEAGSATGTLIISRHRIGRSVR